MSKKIGIHPWVDFAFFKIFGKPGNEVCLISLLNAILDLPYPLVNVRFQNPFSLKDYAKDKQICVDVKAQDSSGRVFVVEIQVVIHPSFAKRAVFYACSAYTDQLEKGESYAELKATYCVCLLMRQLWDTPGLHHHYRLVERTTQHVIEDSIEIHTVELAKYNGTSRGLCGASELEQWCYWIKNADRHTEEELRALLPGLAFLHATSELNEIRELTEERQMYDSREKAILDHLDHQYHLRESLKQAHEEGLKLGREEGLQLGLLEGRQEGRQEGKFVGIEIGSIQMLQEFLGLPVTDPKELIQRPLEELSTLKKMLQVMVRDKKNS